MVLEIEDRGNRLSVMGCLGQCGGTADAFESTLVSFLFAKRPGMRDLQDDVA